MKPPEKSSWSEQVEALQSIIIHHADESRYFVVFDELDEDYKFRSSQQYFNLLTGLFKATQDIRSIFSESGKRLFPIVFLRNDIYDQLQDSDKNKWIDLRADIEWNRERIQSMLSYRLDKASGNFCGRAFDEAWSLIFSGEDVRVGTRQKKRMHTYEYIENSTLLRPRDFVHYLKVGAEDALNADRQYITGEALRWLDKGFSNYLRDEFVDEMHGIIQIEEVFNILSLLRKREFNIEDFSPVFEENVRSEDLKNLGAAAVLRLLFEFSVIGNQPKIHTVTFFKYKNREARVNFKDKFALHRGLYKALQIY
jgi:hypothetical protein